MGEASIPQVDHNDAGGGATLPARGVLFMGLQETSQKLGKRRRKLVKRYGRRALRRVSRFLDNHSLVPKQPFHPNQGFDWIPGIEAQTGTIRAELDRVVEHYREWPRVQELQQDQAGIAADGGWRSFVIYGWGHTSKLGLELCPETARIARTVPGLTSAFFSFVGPNSGITEHGALDGSLLRYHLGLIVPEDREKCALTLDGIPYSWTEGESVVFDDTYRHSVRNDTDELRVVLLLHFERPMDWIGRTLHRGALGLVKRSYYVKDAITSHTDWEDRFRRHVAAETGHGEAQPHPTLAG